MVKKPYKWNRFFIVAQNLFVMWGSCTKALGKVGLPNSAQLCCIGVMTVNAANTELLFPGVFLRVCWFSSQFMHAKITGEPLFLYQLWSLSSDSADVQGTIK